MHGLLAYDWIHVILHKSLFNRSFALNLVQLPVCQSTLSSVFMFAVISRISCACSAKFYSWSITERDWIRGLRGTRNINKALTEIERQRQATYRIPVVLQASLLLCMHYVSQVRVKAENNHKQNGNCFQSTVFFYCHTMVQVSNNISNSKNTPVSSAKQLIERGGAWKHS